MKISKKDISEAEEIGKLLMEIDNINEQHVVAISEEIRLRQPFMLSILLGYQFDLKIQEVEEIMKIYFIIWEYFKDKNNIKNRKIAELQFEKVQKKILNSLNILREKHRKKK